jgi:hypothetical protein
MRFIQSESVLLVNTEILSNSCTFSMSSEKRSAAPLPRWIFKKSTAAATHRDDFLKNLPLPRCHRHSGSGAAAAAAAAPPWTSLYQHHPIKKFLNDLFFWNYLLTSSSNSSSSSYCPSFIIWSTFCFGKFSTAWSTVSLWNSAFLFSPVSLLLL